MRRRAFDGKRARGKGGYYGGGGGKTQRNPKWAEDKRIGERIIRHDKPETINSRGEPTSGKTVSVGEFSKSKENRREGNQEINTKKESSSCLTHLSSPRQRETPSPSG